MIFALPTLSGLHTSLSALVPPLNTALPPPECAVSLLGYSTHYFKTHFSFPHILAFVVVGRVSEWALLVLSDKIFWRQGWKWLFSTSLPE